MERQRRDTVRFAVTTSLNLSLGVALVFAAILRETPMFWRNAGGFPVLMRDLVRLLFYPAAMASTLGCSYASWVALRRLRSVMDRRLVLGALLAQWALWLAALVIAIGDNVGEMTSKSSWSRGREATVKFESGVGRHPAKQAKAESCMEW